MDFDSVVKKRAFVEKFSMKKPAPEKIMELIHTANHAPNPGNLPHVFYVVVDEQKLISELAELCQQDYVKKAPYVIVVCSDGKHLKRLYPKRADRYMKHHVGETIDHLLLKATNEGLGASIVEIFPDQQVHELLGIPEHIEIELIVAVGYSYEKGKSLQAYPTLDTRVFFNAWNNRFYKPIKKLGREDV